jgi:hypothetical protein
VGGCKMIEEFSERIFVAAAWTLHKGVANGDWRLQMALTPNGQSYFFVLCLKD